MKVKKEKKKKKGDWPIWLYDGLVNHIIYLFIQLLLLLLIFYFFFLPFFLSFFIYLLSITVCSTNGLNFAKDSYSKHYFFVVTSMRLLLPSMFIPISEDTNLIYILISLCFKMLVATVFPIKIQEKKLASTVSSIY